MVAIFCVIDCPENMILLAKNNKTKYFRLINEIFSLLLAAIRIICFLCRTKLLISIQMEKITKKEETVLNLFWQNGPMFVKDLLEFYSEPKPHINTLSTYVRSLEAKGYLTHRGFGGSFQYYPAIERQDCGLMSVENIVSRNFGSSYKSLVSCLVHDEKITVDELKELIDLIEKGAE